MYGLLKHWITEREAIRIRKETGQPQPWTKDPILATWRFCNVNRCDDRVTRAIFQWWRKGTKYHGDEWISLVVARLVNWPSSLERMGFMQEWQPKRFLAAMKRPGKVWGGAYIVSTNGVTMPKPEYIAERVITPVWLARGDAPMGNLAEFTNWLTTFNGFKGFMANQVVTDMKYLYEPLVGADDWTSFVLPGPGTKRGMNRLHDLPLNANIPDDKFMPMVLELRHRLSKDLPLPFEEMFLDLNNLTNCLCEFDKYIRVRNGEGKPRAKYAPTQE